MTESNINQNKLAIFIRHCIQKILKKWQICRLLHWHKACAFKIGIWNQNGIEEFCVMLVVQHWKVLKNNLSIFRGKERSLTHHCLTLTYILFIGKNIFSFVDSKCDVLWPQRTQNAKARISKMFSHGLLTMWWKILWFLSNF